MATIAFAGCAHVHAPEFAEMAAEHPGTDVALAWDEDPARANEVAEKTGAERASERRRIWEDPAIEGVVICSETVLHRELVSEALAAGKHLFVEKPISADAREADQLAGAIERSGLTFQTGFFMRGQGAHRALREAISRGRLGEVTRLRISYSNPAALRGWFDDDRRAWTASPALAGFGGFGDEGSHAIDLALWLLGFPRLEQVTASVETVAGRYGAVDEYGEALLRFADGTLASIAAGWADAEMTQAVEAYGTEGRARIVRGEIDGESADDDWLDQLPDDLPHAFELFCDRLAGDEQAPLIAAGEAAATSSALDAAYRAARERAWVAPEPPVGGRAG